MRPDADCGLRSDVWTSKIGASGFGHIVSIERMTPDYLQSTRINVVWAWACLLPCPAACWMSHVLMRYGPCHRPFFFAPSPFFLSFFSFFFLFDRSNAGIQVSGFFPDDFVESPSLFKRGGRYYVTYGSCCCGCQEGGTIATDNIILVHLTRGSPPSAAPTRAACYALLGVHPEWPVFGAWNTMR